MYMLRCVSVCVCVCVCINVGLCVYLHTVIFANWTILMYVHAICYVFIVHFEVLKLQIQLNLLRSLRSIVRHTFLSHTFKAIYATTSIHTYYIPLHNTQIASSVFWEILLIVPYQRSWFYLPFSFTAQY